MTAPMIPPNVLDGALDGLALVQAAVEGNQINRKAILDNTDTASLVTGLVVVAAALRRSLAVAYGHDDMEGVDAALRELLYAAAEGGAS